MLLVLACGCGSEPVSIEPRALTEAYLAELEEWRREREERLRSPDGWLALAGLFWLPEGESTFGSDPGSDLVFPAFTPSLLGVLRRDGGGVEVEAEPGADLLAAGAPVSRLNLESDHAGEPTRLEIGSLEFWVIERGTLVGVRLRDRESPLLTAFAGVESFEPSAAWRLEGRFEHYDPPRKVEVPTIMGTIVEESCPGRVVFDVEGSSYSLEPVGEPGDELFLVFGDETNGKQTYGGGRFLYASPPDAEGRVVVDFNRSYNPPCVFTPYATCPLPRAQNRLPFAIEAGEKGYSDAH